jgi:hypothetical protein
LLGQTTLFLFRMQKSVKKWEEKQLFVINGYNF